MSTMTSDQEINFTNYFSNPTTATEQLEKKKKASRACLHCQRVNCRFLSG